MKCSVCGYDGDENNKFCSKCGVSLQPHDDCHKSQDTVSLVEYDVHGEGQEHLIDKDEFVIGRSPDSDLIISHVSISRRHAVIRRMDKVFTIEDLNSKNGVFVNGFRTDHPTTIHTRDRIRFGDITYIFKIGEETFQAESLPPIRESESNAQSLRLEMLLEMSKLINSSLVLSDVLEQVMDSVMELTRAQRGFLMISGDKDELEFKVARNLDASALQTQQFQISMSSVQRVFQDGKSFILVDIDSDSRVSSQQSIMSLGLKSVMCVPMKHKDRIIGVVYVDSHNVARGFIDEDLQILESLADHASVAIENARLVEENKEMFFSTIEALAEAIEKRDPYTGGHTQRVVELSLDVAKEMNMNVEDQENLKMSALLHDIGKIGIHDSVLRKKRPLTDDEFKKIQAHPQIGADIVHNIHNIEGVLPGILLHHEKIDGSGYPHGYQEDQIPLQAKIIAVADSFDAMITDRPYRKGLLFSAVIQELEENKGTQFDPEVVDIFKQVMDKNQEKYHRFYPSAFQTDSTDDK